MVEEWVEPVTIKTMTGIDLESGVWGWWRS
jgi:hypothetical protein